MKNKIAILILFTSFIINAQYRSLGVSLNSGISIITNDISKIDDSYKNKPGLSGNIGLYYNQYFNNKSLLEIDLLFSLLSSNDSFTTLLFNQGSSLIENRKTKLQRRNYYITLPIKYGIEHNQFIYTIGAHISSDISNYIEIEGAWLNKPANFKETKKNDRYEKLDFGINFGIEKILDSGIILGLSYYHGLNNFGNTNSSIKNRQLVFGIKYEFYRKLL